MQMNRKNTTIMYLIGLAVLMLTLTGTSQTARADWDWQEINDFKSYDYYDFAFNDKEYIVVGNDGIVRTSSDLTNWVTRESGTRENLNGCIWGGEKFVAVGDKGTIIYSQDSQQWNSIVVNEKICFDDVTWGMGKYWAVGNQDTEAEDTYTRLIFSSSDGRNWDKCLENNGDYDWSNIEFLNNKLIAYGFSNDYAISSDGNQWKFQTIGEYETFNDVIWDGNRYIRIDDSFIYTSKDGLDWAKCSHNLNDDAYLDEIVKFKNKYYLLADYNGTYMLASSTDLNNWSMASDQTYDYINSFSVIEGTIFGAGGDETILSSPDGIEWNVSSNCSPDLIKVVWNGNQFLAIGNDGSLLYSSDGTNWTKSSTEIDNSLVDVIWTGKDYLGLAFDYGNDIDDSIQSIIYKSVDGINWREYSKIDDDSPEKLFFINGIYYLLGYDGEILKSSDAIHWIEVDSGTEEYLNSLAWNGRQYVCVGDYGTVITSTDGVKWAKQTPITEVDLECIVWNGIKFVAVSDIVASSNDGVNWSVISEFTNSDEYLWFSDILWDGSRFVLLDEYGVVLTSEDAMEFTQVSADSLTYPYSLAWNGERYVMVGSYGTICTYLPKDIIKVVIKTVPVLFDVAPRIINGRTMIPARAVLEKMGATMTWDGQTQTIQVAKESIRIKLTIGSSVADVNGKEVALDSPAVIIGNRTLVPLRFLVENLGAQVNWNGDTNTVTIL